MPDPAPKKPINPFAAITDAPLTPKTPARSGSLFLDILTVGVIALCYTVYPPLALLVVLLWIIDEIRKTRR